MYWSTPSDQFVRKNLNLLGLTAIEIAEEIDAASILGDVTSLEIKRIVRFAEKHAGRLKEKMSGSVASRQVPATVLADLEPNFLSDFKRCRLRELVDDDRVDLDRRNLHARPLSRQQTSPLVLDVYNRKLINKSSVIFLATRFGVEYRPVQDHKIALHFDHASRCVE